MVVYMPRPFSEEERKRALEVRRRNKKERDQKERDTIERQKQLEESVAYLKSYLVSRDPALNSVAREQVEDQEEEEAEEHVPIPTPVSKERIAVKPKPAKKVRQVVRYLSDSESEVEEEEIIYVPEP